MNSAITLTLHGLNADKACTFPGLDPSAARYVLSMSKFRSLTEEAAKHNCCTIKSFLNQSDGTWVILSFDDGLLSDYEKAFPTLAEKGIKATFFITVENVGKSGYMNIGHIREIASYGMEIGSHGLQHRYLVTLSESEARKEIGVSRDKLEQLLGSGVKSFAPVGGHYKPWMLGFAKDSGYRAFASMIPGRTSKEKEADFHIFRRNHILSHHHLCYIDSLIRGENRTLLINSARYHLLAFPKRLLGMQAYDRLKNLITREASY